jgi:hypothetical protein
MEITLIQHDDTLTIFPGRAETLTVQRDPDLVGQAIRVSEAADKYHISQPTLTRWANRGILTILRREPRVLELDEADVKLATELYHKFLGYTTPQQAGRYLNDLMSIS